MNHFNDFYLDEELNVWLIKIDGLIINEAETYSEALESLKEAMRAKREHLMRNPENEV